MMCFEFRSDLCWMIMCDQGRHGSRLTTWTSLGSMWFLADSWLPAGILHFELGLDECKLFKAVCTCSPEALVPRATASHPHCLISAPRFLQHWETQALPVGTAGRHVYLFCVDCYNTLWVKAHVPGVPGAASLICQYSMFSWINIDRRGTLCEL